MSYFIELVFTGFFLAAFFNWLYLTVYSVFVVMDD